MARSTTFALLGCALIASVATSIPSHWYVDSQPLALVLEPGESLDYAIELDSRLGALPSTPFSSGFELMGPADWVVLAELSGDQTGSVTLDRGMAAWEIDPLADCPDDAPCAADFLLTVTNDGDETIEGDLFFQLFLDADTNAARPSPTTIRLRVERAP